MIYKIKLKKSINSIQFLSLNCSKSSNKSFYFTTKLTKEAVKRIAANSMYVIAHSFLLLLLLLLLFFPWRLKGESFMKFVNTYMQIYYHLCVLFIMSSFMCHVFTNLYFMTFNTTKLLML